MATTSSKIRKKLSRSSPRQATESTVSDKRRVEQVITRRKQLERESARLTTRDIKEARKLLDRGITELLAIYKRDYHELREDVLKEAGLWSDDHQPSLTPEWHLLRDRLSNTVSTAAQKMHNELQRYISKTHKGRMPMKWCFDVRPFSICYPVLNFMLDHRMGFTKCQEVMEAKGIPYFTKSDKQYVPVFYSFDNDADYEPLLRYVEQHGSKKLSLQTLKRFLRDELRSAKILVKHGKRGANTGTLFSFGYWVVKGKRVQDARPQLYLRNTPHFRRALAEFSK